MYIPQAVVKHIGSASTGPKSAFAIYHGHRNLVWTYLKNMPTPLFWLYLPVHLLMNLFFLFYFSFAGQGKAIWKAKWEALQGFKRMARKRKEIQGKRAVPTKSLYRLMDRDLFSPWRTRMQRLHSTKEGE
jgi:GT2 family glycosyltransferase